MGKAGITLRKAIEFHGHLGPYLILGILAGELALKTLRCEKFFGLDVKVWGANKRPKSCLVDGLQLSTGATYGKGNIHKFNSSEIKVFVCKLEDNKKIEISLKEDLINRLNNLKGHKDSESLARELYKAKPLTLFELTTYDL
jgi:formylmethanofuran dehydrogenase subunit E